MGPRNRSVVELDIIFDTFGSATHDCRLLIEQELPARLRSKIDYQPILVGGGSDAGLGLRVATAQRLELRHISLANVQGRGNSFERMFVTVVNNGPRQATTVTRSTGRRECTRLDDRGVILPVRFL